MYKKTVLDNSLRIVTERLPSRLVSIGIWVEIGSRDEDDCNNGTAHFVEHMFFKGTRLRSAQQIAKELDMLGGMSNAFTSAEHTCFYLTVIDDRLGAAVELLADLFLNSAFAPEEIDRERQVILQEIAMVEDTPDDLVHEMFSALYWRGHGLANPVLGRGEVVSALDCKRLTEFVRVNYRPERIVIAAAGNVDHRSFAELCRNRFKMAPPADERPPERRPPQPDSFGARRIVERSLEQAHTVMGTTGLPVDSPDRYKHLLLNSILGGNMSSRLFQEIREKRGLAYSVFSYLSTNSDSGYTGIYLGVDPGSWTQAVELIHKELAKLRLEGITEAELAGAAEYARGGIYLAAENMEVRMVSLAKNEFSFGRYLSIEELTDAIAGVRREGINELAGALFAEEHLPMCVVGPISAKLMNA
ncbi:MAG: pitrilysin family protein [Desulfurivibrionaceae bacterium]|nr:pitrilysin family protein [Desulfobulbales bacterium]MDT8334665.1 pitrilysin family protein [Desulfurivibrionaceae bacterium]